jgi:hypothetical protein
MADRQRWQGGDVPERQRLVAAGYWQAKDGQWYPVGAAPVGTADARPSAGTGGGGRGEAAGGATPTTWSAVTNLPSPPGGYPHLGRGYDEDGRYAGVDRGYDGVGGYTGDHPDGPHDGAPLAPAPRPRGLRNWPTSARVTIGVLAFTTLLGFGAAAAAAPHEDVRAGSAVTTEAPVTTARPTTTSPAPAPSTAPPATTPTTAPPTTVAPPAPPTTAAPPPTTAAPTPQPLVAAPERAIAAPSVYYENCDAARAAGAAPVFRGDPGYGGHLDRDGDGVGCE